MTEQLQGRALDEAVARAMGWIGEGAGLTINEALARLVLAVAAREAGK